MPILDVPRTESVAMGAATQHTNFVGNCIAWSLISEAARKDEESRNIKFHTSMRFLVWGMNAYVFLHGHHLKVSCAGGILEFVPREDWYFEHFVGWMICCCYGGARWVWAGKGSWWMEWCEGGSSGDRIRRPRLFALDVGSRLMRSTANPHLPSFLLRSLAMVSCFSY